MGMIGNIAVEGCAKEILAEIDRIAKLVVDTEAHVALAALRDFVEDIRVTAEAGYY